MRTEILPGYSAKNRDWAESIKRELGADTYIVYWSHWNSEIGTNDQWIADEVHKFNEIHGGQELNLLAKSIGTLVAMKILYAGKVRINKLILCGIPVNDLDQNDNENYKILQDLAPEKVIIFQNNEDPHGNISDLGEFLSFPLPGVKIVSKQSNNHEYPYAGDFIKFLNNS